MEAEWSLEIDECAWELLAAHLLDGAEPGHSLLSVSCDTRYRRWSLRTPTASVHLQDQADDRRYVGYVPADLIAAWPAMAGDGSRCTLAFTHTDSGQFCSLFGPGGSITTRVLRDARDDGIGHDLGGPTVAAGSFEVESLRGVVDVVERSLVDRLGPKEIAATDLRLHLKENKILDVETLRPELRRTAQALRADNPTGAALTRVGLGALRAALALFDDGPMSVEFVRSSTMLRLCWAAVTIEIGSVAELGYSDLHAVDTEAPDLATLLADTFGRRAAMTSDGLSFVVPVPGVPITADLCDAAAPRVELRASAGLDVAASPALLAELNRINATAPYAVAYVNEDLRLLVARVDVAAVGRDVPGLAAAVERLQHLANDVLVPLAALHGAGTVPVAEHERCRWMMQQSFAVPIDRAGGSVDLTGDFAVDPWPGLDSVHIISTAADEPFDDEDTERLAALAGQLVARRSQVGWISEGDESFLTVIGLDDTTVRDLASEARCDAVLTITEQSVVAVSLPDRRRWTRRRMALSDVATDLRGGIEDEEWDNSPELDLPFDQH